MEQIYRLIAKENEPEMTVFKIKSTGAGDFIVFRNNQLT